MLFYACSWLWMVKYCINHKQCFHLFQVRDFGCLQLPDSAENSANILVFQVSARIPFRTEIVFVS
ncbi:hypothetical protein LINPERHAP2_LOCUS9080, partial [Linum perenne]